MATLNATMQSLKTQYAPPEGKGECAGAYLNVGFLRHALSLARQPVFFADTGHWEPVPDNPTEITPWTHEDTDRHISNLIDVSKLALALAFFPAI